MLIFKAQTILDTLPPTNWKEFYIKFMPGWKESIPMVRNVVLKPCDISINSNTRTFLLYKDIKHVIIT